MKKIKKKICLSSGARRCAKVQRNDFKRDLLLEHAKIRRCAKINGGARKYVKVRFRCDLLLERV